MGAGGSTGGRGMGMGGLGGMGGMRPISYPPYAVIPPAMPIANMPLQQPAGMPIMTTPSMLPMPPAMSPMMGSMNPMMPTSMMNPMMGAMPGLPMQTMQTMPPMPMMPPIQPLQMSAAPIQLPYQQPQIMMPPTQQIQMPTPMAIPPPPVIFQQPPPQPQPVAIQQPVPMNIQPPQPYPLDQWSGGGVFQNLPQQSYITPQEMQPVSYPTQAYPIQPSLKVTNLPPTLLRNQPYRQIPVETYPVTGQQQPQYRPANLRNQNF